MGSTIMAKMADEQVETFADVARAVGCYPEEAYHFVREGLNSAVELIHGPPTPALLAVTQYLAEQEIDLVELHERLERGRLEPKLAKAIQAAGGYEKLNRHVGGAELCWALRDLAQQRWGMLAEMVLQSWNITETLDFGRIVFALIQHDFMQRQPHDRLDDFDQVYNFEEALTKSFRFDSEDGADDS